ncbi:MAG: hypothetical protein CMH28_06395 [Micavibrio sp.]|nr:hypothetical protein [Micavibrio sp.]|tara:strand:- start:78 stop:902 length:825 start_codon:yes stop_codon:yes gene_type:complete
MKKRKAFTLAALFMAAASSLELSGYSWLDQSDGNNVLCDIDPSCRYLTNGEVDTLKTVFDDTLNYDSIKIFERSWFFGLDGLARNGLSRLGIDVESYRISNAIAPNGNIYLNSKKLRNGDLSANSSSSASLLHEATHVWQHQSGNDILKDAFEAWLHTGRNYKLAYKVDVNDNLDFADYKIEQQAKIVENWFKRRSSIREFMDKNTPLWDELLKPSEGIGATSERNEQYYNVLAEKCGDFEIWDTLLKTEFSPEGIPACEHPQIQSRINENPEP